MQSFVDCSKINMTEQQEGGEDIRYAAHGHPYVERRRPWQKDKEPEFDFYIVLDYEATCDTDDDGARTPAFPRTEMEVIEFPAVIVDARQRPAQVVPDCEFQEYVKPVLHPELTEFCTGLTGITQETVEAGCSFTDAYNRFLHWLARLKMYGANQKYTACIVTCGDWDQQTMLPQQLLRTYAQTGTKLAFPAVMKQWVNVKVPYKQALRRGGGLDRMLQGIGQSMTGRHHSGLSDCHNTAKIVTHLLNRTGAWLKATGETDIRFFRERAAKVEKTLAQHKRETDPRHIAGLHERLHPEEEQSTQSKKNARRTLQRQKKRLAQERGEWRGARGRRRGGRNLIQWMLAESVNVKIN
jgi:ERI1 exoribonuclease 3